MCHMEEESGDTPRVECAFFFPPHLKACGRASQVAQVVKNPPANAGGAGDVDLIPGSGRSPGGGNGNPLQDSCLEEPVDRGAWRANSLWGSQELDTTDSARSSTAASNLVTTIRIYSGLPCIYYSFTHILTEFSKQPMNQVLLLSSLYRCGVWGPEDGSH